MYFLRKFINLSTILWLCFGNRSCWQLHIVFMVSYYFNFIRTKRIKSYIQIRKGKKLDTLKIRAGEWVNISLK